MDLVGAIGETGKNVLYRTRIFSEKIPELSTGLPPQSCRALQRAVGHIESRSGHVADDEHLVPVRIDLRQGRAQVLVDATYRFLGMRPVHYAAFIKTLGINGPSVRQNDQVYALRLRQPVQQVAPGQGAILGVLGGVSLLPLN